MKVKDLIEKLNKMNENARVIFIHEHKDGVFYTEFDSMEYNVNLENNKLKINKELLLINLK